MSLVRIECEGIESVPAEGGALLVVRAIVGRPPMATAELAQELEARIHRSVRLLAEPSGNGRAHELLHDGQQLGLVDDGALTWAVETAWRAGVPVVPAVVGADRLVVLPAVHFDARANQRRYDPAMIARAVAQIAGELREVRDPLDAEPGD